MKDKDTSKDILRIVARELGTEDRNVNHPSHYTNGKIEVIDFIEDNLGEGFEYYLVGNIMKYLCRYRYKNGVEDLKKAKWYLEKLIEVKEASK